MKIRVLLFAKMRVDAGTSSVDLELPAAARVTDAIEVLLDSHPELRGHEESCMTAVGVEYAPTSHVLEDGDEVSLIPPVQGG